MSQDSPPSLACARCGDRYGAEPGQDIDGCRNHWFQTAAYAAIHPDHPGGAIFCGGRFYRYGWQRAAWRMKRAVWTRWHRSIGRWKYRSYEPDA